ncbi:MAG: dienelactone hydrolase [Hyphomicrobiales bacterium]|nr:dienelactone hydrolase [Hyphomicrobiales bacterium]
MACLALISIAPRASAEIVEKVVKLPVRVSADGETITREITLTVLRDDARKKSPFMILNHGRSPTAEGRAKFGRAVFRDQTRYFVQLGYAVFLPTRVGYGVTGGPDVESSGACNAKDYAAALAPAVAQVAAAVTYAQAQDYVDGSRGVVMGASVGGFTTIAASAASLRGVKAAVNFAGGAGGDPDHRTGAPCQPERIAATYGAYGARSHVPTLWLYAPNDRYWGASYPKQWFSQFVAQGGRGEFVALPPSGEDGHLAFTRDMESWKPSVAAFLRKAGL